MILGDRNGRQFTLAATDECMNHSQRECIVDVIADVSIEHQGHWSIDGRYGRHQYGGTDADPEG